METHNPFVEEVFHFRGEWGVSSRCGLKIVRLEEKTVILVTEFYDSNPGTSITEWNTHLASEICQKYAIDPKRVIFIEHTPEMSSTLTLYQETFDRVTFKWDGKSFSDPQWERVSKEDIIDLIKLEL